MPTPPKLQLAQNRSAFIMDKATIERFLHHCRRTQYSAKQNVFTPGDKAGSLYYVVSGSLAIVSEEQTKPKSQPPRRRPGGLQGFKSQTLQNQAPQNQAPRSDLQNDQTSVEPLLHEQELVLGYANAGEFVGELGLFILPNSGRHVTFRTRTVSEIAEIEYDKLLNLLANELAEDCPKILYSIGANISKRLFSVSRKASSLAFVDVTERIMRTVFELAQHPEALTHPDGMQIKASRQELARLAGCSREMAGRALKQLEKDGRLTAHGKTIVLFCER